ncbi:30S ribosomal protein S11 [Candidatus Beckwithbacteria bacterium CG10_big_fil_rev_8_21_14_0_10_34_10]|uniref:Small ribosomal subunit protein uS11 n=1 Tax=Candidatus Beckwithbacteria bacterium CG10_big_fil_rev_8_21_14_0_10_34_10 TaxID=1974495 RepID=A0A2H0W7V1_9BACT|nr:MAG: 30S ribosomal protein S11 [Candidatus Beckwithbacteria bacterium CG10_big_fil_rev_8_21_14_0_10_34_10]
MTEKRVTKGRIYITATFNNTLVTITDDHGNTLCWGTSGSSGFKGSRKSTPFAATSAVERVINQAKTKGLIEAQCFIKGPGPGRDAALRVLRTSGIRIPLIADVTPMPHNGCRPKKRRRV